MISNSIGMLWTKLMFFTGNNSKSTRQNSSIQNVRFYEKLPSSLWWFKNSVKGWRCLSKQPESIGILVMHDNFNCRLFGQKRYSLIHSALDWVGGFIKKCCFFAYYQYYISHAYLVCGWVRKYPKTCLCNKWTVPYLVKIHMVVKIFPGH